MARVQVWGLGFRMIFTLAFTHALTLAWMHSWGGSFLGFREANSDSNLKMDPVYAVPVSRGRTECMYVHHNKDAGGPGYDVNNDVYYFSWRETTARRGEGEMELSYEGVEMHDNGGTHGHSLH